MRKSDILTGPCQGGPWAARTLTSTNGLVWVPDVQFGCYRFLFGEGVWQWRNGHAEGPVGERAPTHVNGSAADAAGADATLGCANGIAVTER